MINRRARHPYSTYRIPKYRKLPYPTRLPYSHSATLRRSIDTVPVQLPYPPSSYRTHSQRAGQPAPAAAAWAATASWAGAAMFSFTNIVEQFKSLHFSQRWFLNIKRAIPHIHMTNHSNRLAQVIVEKLFSTLHKSAQFIRRASPSCLAHCLVSWCLTNWCCIVTCSWVLMRCHENRADGIVQWRRWSLGILQWLHLDTQSFRYINSSILAVRLEKTLRDDATEINY